MYYHSNISVSFVLIVTSQIVFKLNTVFAFLFPINTIISLSYGMTLSIRLSVRKRFTQQFKYLFSQLFQSLTNIYWDINSISLHFPGRRMLLPRTTLVLSSGTLHDMIDQCQRQIVH